MMICATIFPKGTLKSKATLTLQNCKYPTNNLTRN